MPFSTASTIASRAGSGCGASRVLVVPGTDHAAISTNMKVEQKLAEEGLDPPRARPREVPRALLGVDRPLRRPDHRAAQGPRLFLRLGAHPLHARRSLLPRRAHRLRALLRTGWVYRGHRVVNWCPTCSSTVSDLEVEHVAHSGHFWHINIRIEGEDGYVIVATTRPETMLGDTAVAVNSKDPRYQHLHGKRVSLPLLGRVIPIITDDVLVDPEFGTGAVKVTPAHDLNDYEAGQRNELDSVVVIAPGRDDDRGGRAVCRLDRYEARTRVIEDLQPRACWLRKRITISGRPARPLPHRARAAALGAVVPAHEGAGRKGHGRGLRR